MQGKLSLAVVGAVVLAPMSASADIAPRGELSIGVNTGGHDHPDDGGFKLGADIAAGARLGMFIAGARLGYDTYALVEGAPVHATSVIGHAGIAATLARYNTTRRIEIDAISSLEAGVHRYSAAGTRNHFLGGSTEYFGDTRSTKFLGVRAGVAFGVFPSSSTGVVFKVEVVGRRDLETVDLEYSEIDCGGLFADDDDCGPAATEMTTVGGTELGVVTSIGVSFGR